MSDDGENVQLYVYDLRWGGKIGFDRPVTFVLPHMLCMIGDAEPWT